MSALPDFLDDVEMSADRRHRENAARLEGYAAALALSDKCKGTSTKGALAMALVAAAAPVAWSVLEDLDAPTPGPCECGRNRDRVGCTGPRAHWTPVPLLVESKTNDRRNATRRTDNASRLETLAWAVHVLRRDCEGAGLDLDRFERWILDTWNVRALPPDDTAARRDWAERRALSERAPMPNDPDPEDDYS